MSTSVYQAVGRNGAPVFDLLPASHSPHGLIPESRKARERMRAAARRYVREERLVPPLSEEELETHTSRMLAASDISEKCRAFVTILISNAIWWRALANVPFDRRVFLLPRCLQATEGCRAETDAFGLLCQRCGKCPIGPLQTEAEELGYVLLVAEGTTMVTRLLETGKVDAVVGVSCLDVLERTFPYMAAQAVPGIAIPLLRNGCENTVMDLPWVREALHLRQDHKAARRVDLDRIRRHVDQCFAWDSLSALLGTNGSQTERIAAGWVAKAGKRWRPFLAASVYAALRGESDELPETVRKIAVAVECFHKASLVHDDIEDGDDLRYGEPTLHKQHGVPIALNAGDLLLGEGYRLIAEAGASSRRTARMLEVAAAGHRNLSLGQGEELNWIAHPAPLSTGEVIDLFRRKTAPAFEVAMRLGAIAGGADDGMGLILKTFSEALGIAYQIRDDIEDFLGPAGTADADALRPSLLLAMAHDEATPEDRARFDEVWAGRQRGAAARDTLRAIAAKAGVEQKARQMFDLYRTEALRALTPLRNANLKALLHRITGKVLGLRGIPAAVE